MARGSLIWLALCATLWAGCGDKKPPVDRVGVNTVHKDVFKDSSWYFNRTVIDVDYEGGPIGTFPGDTAMDFSSSNFSLPRVRWVIEEKLLLAYRDYELAEGANPDSPQPGELRGQPVAAFEIEKHFDIRRAYDDATGEEQNVIVENDEDRPWYEREFMRVNWASNALPAYYGQVSELNALLGVFEREPAEFFVQAASEFPDSWQPRFHQMPCEGVDDSSEACSQDARLWAADYEAGQVYAFDFVSQELITPGVVFDPLYNQEVDFCVSTYLDAPGCVTTAVYVRNSFLRVSEERQYEPVDWVDSRFERAGFFRLERPTVDRSSAADDPAYFETDFLNYSVNRHNLWQQWRDADGAPIPYAERRVRPIVYHLTPELPAHLVEPSFELVARWNEVLMQTVRRLRGEPEVVFPELSCQTEDPDGYCACISDPDTGAILNPTCPGRYDPFETPAEAAARGVQNPFDCWVDVPAGARPQLDRPDLQDSHFNGWFQAEQTGDECVLRLAQNACNRLSIDENGDSTEGLSCQERGDSRFKFLSYVDQPGTPFLGIATLRGDPVTGELIVGDANIGGPALDRYRTTALQMYDLIHGDISDQEFLTGEDVRAYLENLDRVELPARPRIDFNVALQQGSASTRDLRTVDQRMSAFLERAAALAGPAGRSNTFIDRRAALVGSDIEHRTMQSLETLMLAGVSVIPDGFGPADINEPLLDAVSPFRKPVHEQFRSFIEQESLASRMNVMMPNEYVDDSVLFFVKAHRDWPRARLEIALNQMLYFQTQLHELGHCLGLRHDFGASADHKNYDDEYYQIIERIPLPDPARFEQDGVPGLSAEEQIDFESALDAARSKRELAGIDRHMDSSIMEYTAQWYERVHSEAGRYDVAAVNFAYGDFVEVYDNVAGRTQDEVTPVNTERLWAKYYHGGQECRVDADCPFSLEGANAQELTEANLDAGLTQRCLPHAQGLGANGTVCSRFDDDVAAIVEQDAPSPQLPVDYRFCSDERVGTLGWCHRFDEGASYRDIVRNVAEQYERQYIFTNFRRFRSDFDIGPYLADRLIGRQFTILQDVFQNLLFRYQADPAFRTDEGDLGFYDQFMASADVLNFYARILGQPNIGSYGLNPTTGNFERFSASPGVPGSDLDLSIGLGRYLFSTYQSGLTGINRLERIGSFYDKWIAMQMLTQRGWTTAFTRDVPFWTNFYDLFPVEMQQIFQGIIQDEPESISPRVRCEEGPGAGSCSNPRVVYMDFYRGDCSSPQTCRPDPIEETYADLDVLDGGSSVLLQFIAAAFALSDFPVFFDTTFQNQLFICIEGEGDCFVPSATSVEGVDFVRHSSARFNKTFVAFQVEPSVSVPNQESIGFNMVKEAADNAFAIAILERLSSGQSVLPAELDALDARGYRVPLDEVQAGNDLATLDRRQRDLESFFFQLIDLQRQLGIASYLRF